MFVRSVAAVAALLACAPLHAQTAQPVVQSTVGSGSEVPSAAFQPVVVYQPSTAGTGAILWRNVRAGMTSDVVHTMFPRGGDVDYENDRVEIKNVVIVDKCKADVDIMHKSGVVDEVVVKGDGAIAGRCADKIIVALSTKYGQPLDTEKSEHSLFAREGKIFVWSKDGVSMRLKRFTNGALGGGGLGRRSWELRYTTLGNNVDL